MQRCYKSSPAMLSVVSRAHKYALEARRFHPTLTDEEAFLMWVNRKVARGDIKADSALQYVTYYRMSRVNWMSAYRRSVRLSMDKFEDRRTRDAGRTPTKEEIQQVVSRRANLHTMALRFQWSTACRFIDLQRIRLDHMWTVDAQQVMILCPAENRLKDGPVKGPFWPRHLDKILQGYDYANGWLDASSGKRVTKASYEGEIASTAPPFDHEALLQDFPGLRINMKWLLDPAFISSMLRPGSFVVGPGPRNSRMMPHVDRLLQLGIAAPVPKAISSRWFHGAFTVDKRAPGQLRFILSCESVNRATAHVPLPACDLPSYATIVSTVLSRSWVAEFDFRSFFFQFALPPEVRKYFCFRVEGRLFWMTRLPMGYRAAPQAAQAVSLELAAAAAQGLDVEVLAWIDNVIFVANTEADVAQASARFKALTSKYGLTIGSWSKPATRAVLLGLEFDLEVKSWHVDPSWIAKAGPVMGQILELSAAPVRIWWKLTGSLLWRRHVMGFPLHGVLPLLQWMSALASGRSSSDSAFWDTVASCPTAVKSCLLAQCIDMRANAWRQWSQPAFMSSIDVVSDASMSAWAYVIGDFHAHGRFPPELAPADIFMKELYAVVRAVQHAVRGRAKVDINLLCDNKAVIGCVRRGYTLRHDAMQLLTLINQSLAASTSRPNISYVPSLQNIADQYTRL
ncbi:Pol polyprotein, partial [Diplonema papillatum]